MLCEGLRVQSMSDVQLTRNIKIHTLTLTQTNTHNPTVDVLLTLKRPKCHDLSKLYRLEHCVLRLRGKNVIYIYLLHLIQQLTFVFYAFPVHCIVTFSSLPKILQYTLSHLLSFIFSFLCEVSLVSSFLSIYSLSIAREH